MIESINRNLISITSEITQKNNPVTENQFRDILLDEIFKLAKEDPVNEQTKHQHISSNTQSVFLPFINSTIQKTASSVGVNQDLIHAIVKAESSYNPTAISNSGAIGLMQLMPQTAQFLGVNDPYDIEQNIQGGSSYIKNLLNRYDNNLPLALAAYNAGPGNVDKYGGIPPFDETINYVNKIMNYLPDNFKL